MPTPTPAVFLLGISGVGKSVVADHLQSNHGWLLLDVDAQRGFEGLGLGREWKGLHKGGDAPPLARAVQARAIENGAAGVVLSLPSTCVLAIDEIRAADEAGLRTVVLWGDWDLCKEARAARGKEEGKEFDEAKYAKRNKSAFDTYRGDDCVELHLDAFGADGVRIRGENLAAEIQRRLGRRSPKGPRLDE